MPLPASSGSRLAPDQMLGPVLNRLQSLADETRARILLLLELNEYSVGEICQVVQLPQSTVSRHLGLLLQEGWVRSRSEGTSRHYRFSKALDPSAAQLWDAVRDNLSGAASVQEDRHRARSVLEAREEGSRAFFRSEAGRWDQVRAELFGERVDCKLLPALLHGTEVIADLGCGTGHLTRLLAPFAKEVIALDRSPPMLEVARRRLRAQGNVEVVQGELTALPIESGRFDRAILSLVLHYVVDLDQALSEVHRTLRPEGRILILEMQEHGRVAFAEEMGHVWLGFNPKELKERLEDIGFRSVRVATVPPDPKVKGPGLFLLQALRPERSTETPLRARAE